MINKITITNHLGESIAIEPRFPEKSGFLVRSIDGLGPSKAHINMSEAAAFDGSMFNSSRVTSRNIVFSFYLVENPTIEETRLKAYKYFPIKKRIKLLFETDTRICYTYGYVESNEPDIFTSQETTNISIICPDPYFYSIGNDITIFSTIEPEFEFPFSNESTGESFEGDPLWSDLLEMGEIQHNDEKSILYSGDASVGMVMYIHAIGPVTNLEIINTKTLESMKIDSTKLVALIGTGIIDGDDIIISTVKGDKFVHLQRSGDILNILNALDKNADWFQLEKGDNVFVYTADTGDTNLQFRIESQIAYEGI